ncbi:FHA domain-containing protein [Streptomyces fructofermentans]|uniref:FHA domain-containing protein n=1 Tax=Streptomyces fructofermentans TaxID=152141 RepID=UPI0037BAC91B
MQIRLTVVDPLGTRPEGRPASCDVLVTAPAGTALAVVASGLASAVGGEGAGVLYAGAERLDAQRCTLGEPPLIDGAVLSLGSPAEPGPDVDPAAAQLRVVAGPDAGGVHLLHGGRIDIGRSADADVPLDDPDVSRLHCAVTVSADGRVSVADLGSTNGTRLDGTRVGERPVAFAPGALLRIGESALRLAPAGEPDPVRETAPDGEGHVRVSAREPGRGQPAGADARPQSPGRAGPATGAEAARVPHARDGGSRSLAVPPASETHHGYGTADWGAADGGSGAAQDHGPAGPHTVPGQGGTPPIETVRDGGAGQGAEGAQGLRDARGLQDDGNGRNDRNDKNGDAYGTAGGDAFAREPREDTAAPGTSVPPRAVRRRGGLSAWARRLAGGRDDGTAQDGGAHDGYAAPAAGPFAQGAPGPERWPDPAALLLAALGPGPRLWERGPGHPETLTVRLGTADRGAPDGSGLLPAVPVTADLREVGALGLAGPRGRLSGLARAVVAQLAALHSPDALEVTLISTDRSRSVEERTAEWSWLGWLPHLRPTHGQDCRLLLAFDREQATARTEELLRRLEDHAAETDRAAAARAPRAAPGGSPDDSGAFASAGRTGREGTPEAPWRGADRPDGSTGRTARDGRPPADGGPPETGGGSRTHPPARDTQATHLGLPLGGARPARQTGLPDRTDAPTARDRDRRPSWARSDDAADSMWPGPHTVVVVDGDPGSAGVREAISRLAAEGPRAGVHVVCLAETPAASPASPVAHTYEAACAASPPFRACGAVALLSGDVATALRLLRVAPGAPGQGPAGGPVGHGTVASVDAVSMAWAERFARALAPLRTDGAGGERHPRVSAPLPQAARLLDELGLARATPASLMARWADAADDSEALGGRATAVLGAGPRGPVCVDLAQEGPHLLIEGPPGSGRTELLRSVAASLAAAERPDRLGIVLVDGRDGTGGPVAGGRGEGLQVCTDLPHVTTHLGANDPVLMREFAQSLAAELKRRAELLGRLDFAEWHARQEVPGRVVAQRPASGPGSSSPRGPGAAGAEDLDTPSSSTLRLRPPAARPRPESGPVLPRLVVVVDDLDALLAPALGSPGRPAAGSVVRALEAVAREGGRLGVHLVASTGGGTRTDGTELARRTALRVVLEAPAAGPEEPAPGRGRLTGPAGRPTPLQGGRVTGRIPRTATLRPTVVPLEWARMGDPPARRPVRELGNGPTDLALLASALERAARSVSASEVPSLL